MLAGATVGRGEGLRLVGVGCGVGLGLFVTRAVGVGVGLGVTRGVGLVDGQAMAEGLTRTSGFELFDGDGEAGTVELAEATDVDELIDAGAWLVGLSEGVVLDEAPPEGFGAKRASASWLVPRVLAT